jgi:gamma-glutamyltranspeptidase
VITAADLAAYQVAERAPLRGAWRGLRSRPCRSRRRAAWSCSRRWRSSTAPRPIWRALGAGSSAALHVIVEAAKHGFADRARALGDTDAGRAAAAGDARAPVAADHDGAHGRLDRTQPSARYGLPAPVDHARARAAPATCA